MKKNKSLIIILLILVVGVIGLTLAYFANTANITNEFKSKEYGTTVTEEFTSPENWLPGSTEPKTLTVTNSGQVDEAVRVSYVETWTSKNGDNLSLTQGNNRAAIINFNENGDWSSVTENNKTYYYYNYKLSSQEVTSTLLNSVTFNSAITNTNNCTSNETATGKQIVCSSTGDEYDGATYRLTFTVETVQYDKYKDAWSTNTYIASMKPMTVQQFIARKTNASSLDYNDVSADKRKMFVFNHEATEQTDALTDYRYIGDSPDNFVYFNCTDDNDTDSCEVWRIIGVFSVERTDPNDSTKTITEQRIKLVRGSDFSTTMIWDVRTSDENGYPWGKNDWNGSYISTYLNGTYYTDLSEIAQSQTEDAIYYLGGREYKSPTHFGSTEDIYIWERGTTLYNNTRLINWEGKISLMYTSDMYMTYGNGVDDTCYNDPYFCRINYYSWETSHPDTPGIPTTSWVYKTNVLQDQSSQNYSWFVSPNAGNSYEVFLVKSDGDLGSYGGNGTYGVRPVLYLKSSIQIIEGEGTEQSPYVLQ